MVGHVLFDYYFTLADPRPSTDLTMAALLGDLLGGVSRLEFEAERAALVAEGAWQPRAFCFDGPIPAFESFHDQWCAYGEALLGRFGVKGGGTAYAEARRRAHATAPLFPEVAEALGALRARGIQVGVLSDADDYLRTNVASHGLSFDVVLTSEDLSCYKPHHRVFQAALDALGTDPESTVYVGDGPVVDVEGARRAGLEAIWIDRDATPWPAELKPPRTTIQSLLTLCGALG